MPDLNPNIYYDQYGSVHSSDADLERIIRAVEEENHATLAGVIPAITFDGGDPDDKIYLLLLTMYNDIDTDGHAPSYTYKEWLTRVGRQATYDYLKELIKQDAIDPNESFVIAGESDPDVVLGITVNKDNVKFDCKPITVYRFMRVMFDERRVLDDKEDFDINEYDPCDYEHGDKTIMEI